MPKLTLTQSEKSIETDLANISPTYGTDKAACFDIRCDLLGRDIKVKWTPEGQDENTFTISNCSGEFYLQPNTRALIPTGWVFGFPEEYRLNLVPRSGVAWNDGVTVLNAPATIESDYTGEVFVVLINHSGKPFHIKHGDRVCQGELNLINRVELPSMGVRKQGDKGGFNSTGKA